VNIPNRQRKIKYRASSETISSFSGLKLVTDLAARLGILKGLEAVTVKKRRRGIPICDFVMSVVNVLLAGGQHLKDLDRLREEKSTRKLLYGLVVPAPTTAGETLRKFSLGHIKQIERVIRQALLRSVKIMGGSERITLDLDSSVFEAYGDFKEGVRPTYYKNRGFNPVLCFWSETRLLLGARLRPGNRHSDHKAISFLRECLSRLPRNRRIRIRCDSGFYNRFFVQELLRREVSFSITARLTSLVRNAIESLAEEAWAPYPWEEGTQWTECSIQPTRWPQAFRLVVKRTEWFEGNQRVLGKYLYTPIITNHRGAGSSLIKHHLARGGAENYIEEFKNGLGARLLPSQCFMANWAWLVIAQLAYNLAQWFKLLLLPAKEQAQQLKSLRLHWWCVAGRLVRSARCTVLYVAKGQGSTQRLLKIQNAIMRL
jgi:hypothetical protein